MTSAPKSHEFSEDVRDLHGRALRVCEAFHKAPQPELFTDLERVAKTIVTTARTHGADCIGVAFVAPADDVEIAVTAGFTAGLLHATLESDVKRAALSVFSCLAGTDDSAGELLKLVDLWAAEDQIVISWETAKCLETEDWTIYEPSAVLRPESALAVTSLTYAKLRSNEESPDAVCKALTVHGNDLAKSCATLLQATFGYLPPYISVALASGEKAIVLETSSFLEISRPIAAILTDENGSRIGAKIRRLGRDARRVTELLSNEPAYFKDVRRKYQTDEENADWTSSSSLSIHESIKTLQGGFISRSSRD